MFSRSSNLRIVLTGAAGVTPYVAGLRRLEQQITYPIADGADHFWIDHGPSYTPFFTELGEAWFAIVLDGDEVAGNGVGILRKARALGKELVAGYGCDYKIAPTHRGTGLGRKLGLFGLKAMLEPKNAAFRSWRFAYGAAMRGARGDVLQSGKGLHPLKLLGPYARLLLYFVEPTRLAALDPEGAPASPAASSGLDLSPEAGTLGSGPGIVSTAGKKDLRLVSTGEPWPLQHLALGPDAWLPTHAHYLRRCGEALVASGLPGPACFGLDQRLEPQVRWLSERGLTPGATCNIVAWRLFPRIGPLPWVHLATSEI